MTPREVQLCGLIRANLTSKDIAQLLNLSTLSVEQARYIICKKLDIETEQNLSTFLMGF